MKMILTLIKNEYIKLFKKKSVPILLFLLVLFIFGISLIKPTRYYYSRDISTVKSAEGYKQRKQEFEYMLEDFKRNPYVENNDAVNKVIEEFYEKQIELCDKAIYLGMTDPDDWRYAAINDLLNINYTEYLLDYSTGSGEYVEQVKEYVRNFEIYNYNYNRYVAYSATLKAIEENNYSESKRELYNKAVSDVEKYKAKLEELNKQKNNGAGGDDFDLEIYKINGKIANGERIVRAYKCMLDKKFAYKSVQDETLNYTISSLSSAISDYESLITKEEYEKRIAEQPNGEYVSIISRYNNQPDYEEYCKTIKERIASNENKGLIGLYSLENDVIEMTVADSSRSKSLSFVNLFWIIAPLAIYFASSMVSQEFSTRTINLLLIRPVKRWKILLSKYICIITLIFGMIAVCGAVYLFGTGINLGFADFSQPYIYVASGAAHAANFILWFLWKVLIASIPIFCLVNLTFMFSTVTKGTAVSLILGVLSLFSSILILFFSGLFDNPDVMTYMPFPYFSMWSYVFDDIVYLNGSSGNVFSYIIKADLTYGFIILLGLIILSVVLAFADFTKKDIK